MIEGISCNKDIELNSNQKEFRSITENMLKTYIEKNTDYGDSFNKSIEEFGIIAAVVRMNDKMNRIKNLCKNQHVIQVKNETIEDTLLDLANYCILTVINIRNNESIKS